MRGCAGVITPMFHYTFQMPIDKRNDIKSKLVSLPSPFSAILTGMVKVTAHLVLLVIACVSVCATRQHQVLAKADAVVWKRDDHPVSATPASFT